MLNDKVNEDVLLKFKLSESGNAELFKHLFGNKFCFIKEKKTWFFWVRGRWIEYGDQIKEDMLCTIRLREEVIDKIDDKERKEFLNKLEILQTNYKVDAALKFLKAFLTKSYTDFDKDPYVLVCRNGILDLRTGEFREATPNDFVLKSCGINYDPTAKCPKWLKFLDEIFLGDQELIDFMQRAIGYTLTGSLDEQCMFICYNKGSNGKSTFLNIIENLLGEYAITTPASTFKKRKGDDDIPHDVARMCGTRFIKCVEINEGDRLNEERIKALTGGDKITARFLHKGFFEFYPTGKIWWAVNHKPYITGTDEAIWRRIRLIPFDAHFDGNNKRPQEEIISELKGERPGILNWAIEGCLEWQKRGLEPIDKIRKATVEYRIENDFVGRFLKDCTEDSNENDMVKASDLYKVYQMWCKDNGEEAQNSTVFGNKLSEQGFTENKGKKKRLGSGWHYLGLKLTDEMEKKLKEPGEK